MLKLLYSSFNIRRSVSADGYSEFFYIYMEFPLQSATTSCYTVQVAHGSVHPRPRLV